MRRIKRHSLLDWIITIPLFIGLYVPLRILVAVVLGIQDVVALAKRLVGSLRDDERRN